MTWSFHAEGHVGENGHLHERELVKKLHELFSDQRYGRAHSSFTGQHVQSEVLGDGVETLHEAGKGEILDGPATAQEPQRMDPPELQATPTGTLNPPNNPVMPIDDPNAVPKLDSGPSNKAMTGDAGPKDDQ